MVCIVASPDESGNDYDNRHPYDSEDINPEEFALEQFDKCIHRRTVLKKVQTLGKACTFIVCAKAPQREVKPFCSTHQKRSVFYDHEHGEKPRRGDHLEWTFSRGSRVCFFSYDSKVETFFSLSFTF